jgi:hypothetical protein
VRQDVRRIGNGQKKKKKRRKISKKCVVPLFQAVGAWLTKYFSVRETCGDGVDN